VTIGTPRLGPELIPGPRHKARSISRIEVAIGLERESLDALPKRKRALVVAETGDVDANDLGRIAYLTRVVAALHRSRHFVRADQRVETGGRELADYADLDPRIVLSARFAGLRSK
jgi:hypothetical protein